MTYVYLVTSNGTILCAYVHRHHAETHALTITGARVREVAALNHLAESALDDISVDEWDVGGDTPVEVEPDGGVTRPDTPRAKLRRVRPEE